MNTPPDCAAVRATVAPTSADWTTVVRVCGPVGAVVKVTVLSNEAAFCV